MKLEDIVSAITAAQKQGDPVRTETLRFLLAQLRNREIEKRGGGDAAPLADEEIMQVIQKEAKKRREAIALYAQGGRNDLKKKEETELVIIETYLPKQLDRAALEAIVKELKAGNQDFNSLIKATMARVKGQADGKLVSEVVKAELGQ